MGPTRARPRWRVARRVAAAAAAIATSALCTSSRASALPVRPRDQDWIALFINLDRREDRRRQLASVLTPANEALLARLQRLPAVDGRNLDLADDSLLRFISAPALQRAREAQRDGAFTIVHHEGRLLCFDDHLTQGGVACVMSHHAALAAVAQHPTARWGLILEDDVRGVVPGVAEAMVRLAQRRDWDAIFLGYHGGRLAGSGADGPDVAAEETKARLELQMSGEEADLDSGLAGLEPGQEPPVVRMFAPLFGLYAWMVTKEAARAALEGAFPVEGQVDYALSRWLVQRRSRAYRVAPRHLLFFSPKSEDGLDSDVQTMVRLRELMDNPDLCERYVGFLQQRSAGLT